MIRSQARELRESHASSKTTRSRVARIGPATGCTVRQHLRSRGAQRLAPDGLPLIAQHGLAGRAG